MGSAAAHLAYERQRARYMVTHVRLTHEDHAILKREAARQGVSMNELITTYITWGLENSEGGLK